MSYPVFRVNGHGKLPQFRHAPTRYESKDISREHPFSPAASAYFNPCRRSFGAIHQQLSQTQPMVSDHIAVYPVNVNSGVMHGGSMKESSFERVRTKSILDEEQKIW